MKNLAIAALTIFAVILLYARNAKAQYGSPRYSVETCQSGTSCIVGHKVVAMSCTDKQCYVLVEY